MVRSTYTFTMGKYSGKQIKVKVEEYFCSKDAPKGSALLSQPKGQQVLPAGQVSLFGFQEKKVG